jgi:predicted dehydrogenase/nucleoside-diphosphate-sugar epimerase
LHVRAGMQTSTKPLQIGFIGAGSMARAHARAIGRLGVTAQIIGVFDADAETGDEFAAAYGGRRFASIEELLTQTQPDVVHVCTTAGAHFDAAQQALLAGAHVYVEKPFVETTTDARALLALAADRRRLVCAGHQLLADPVYETLLSAARRVQPATRAESLLSFASPTLRHDASPRARIAQLLDVVPHPLYTLVDAIERLAPGLPITLASCDASPDAVEAIVIAGGVRGRLFVSLAARPVSSTLAIAGENGTLMADFIRGCVTGVDNPGTSPIEKILNPVFDGAGLAVRSLVGVARRLANHGEYPGLAPLIKRFYSSIRLGADSPTRPDHLLSVVDLYEQIAATVRASCPPERVQLAGRPSRAVRPDAPIVAVTGASGFLGRPLTRELARRGFRVRGIGRGKDPQQEGVHEWVRADLSRDVPPEALEGAYAVVHLAAATSGGFPSHQRHSVEAAARVVDAAALAGVSRLVHISSISVVRPPHGYRERLNESTPMADAPQTLGPYTWGKCVSERVLLDKAATAKIAVRVFRPGAFTDRRHPELPGLAGRRLFGKWHLLLGRPSHAFAACDVELTAAAIAWSVEYFDDAPLVVNLVDPEIGTRRALLSQMRKDGWTGRGVWVPIWFLAGGVMFATRMLSLLRGQRGERVSPWQILRPRQFDPSVSAALLTAMRKSETSPREWVAQRISVPPEAEVPMRSVAGV